MRYRLREWDVAMPAALVSYWTAWNEPDIEQIDHHHDRFRYRWDMFRSARTLMEGIDVVTVDPASGLITRVDGFFGNLTAIGGNGETGVPLNLQRSEDVVE
jgi:hypothetical protein